MPRRLMRTLLPCTLVFALALTFTSAPTLAAPQKAAKAEQKIDAEYSAKIKEYTQDPRIITELVDHLPASDKVPSPLKFLGRIPGTPDELTYYKDIQRYIEALDKALRARDAVQDRQERGRARHDRGRDRGRSDDQDARQVQEDPRGPDRSRGS